MGCCDRFEETNYFLPADFVEDHPAATILYAAREGRIVSERILACDEPTIRILDAAGNLEAARWGLRPV